MVRRGACSLFTGWSLRAVPGICLEVVAAAASKRSTWSPRATTLRGPPLSHCTVWPRENCKVSAYWLSVPSVERLGTVETKSYSTYVPGAAASFHSGVLHAVSGSTLIPSSCAFGATTCAGLSGVTATTNGA